MRIKINDPKVIEKACQVLKNGGIVMHPTETCYGLAVDVFNEKALAKLYKLKGRDAKKPISIMVNGLEMAQKYGNFSEKAIELAEKYWPGPLSIVVERKNALLLEFNKGFSDVSIRMPDHKFCLKMASEFGGPLTTTSANLSGMPPLYISDLTDFGDLADEIDLVVDGGEISKQKPSTIVKVKDNDEIEVLREGSIKL